MNGYIYTLGPLRHPRLKQKYATNSEEIKQLAIDRYWGTLLAPPDRLKVVVDMFALIVTVTDPERPRPSVEDGFSRYKILEYERVIR